MRKLQIKKYSEMLLLCWAFFCSFFLIEPIPKWFQCNMINTYKSVKMLVFYRIYDDKSGIIANLSTY